MIYNFRYKITWRFIGINLLSIILLACFIYAIEYIEVGVFSPPEFLMNLYCTFFCWTGSTTITFLCIRSFKKIEQTTLRIIINLGLVLIFIYFVVLGAFYLFDNTINYSFLIFYLSCTLITIAVSSVYLTIDYFNLYKEKVKETEELKRIQIENEVRILSNQVNPHFLFNSLNTLMSIIPHDAKKAVHFTESFSNVYRYALKNRNNDTVTLKDEIELIKDYCYLLKIRFGKNFKCNIDIPEDRMKAVVPAFAIQLLVENAMKHNAIGDNEPLQIDIYHENDNLIVENNINVKIYENKGTGTGLENIAKRLKYLTDRNMEVEKNAQIFKVSVPLMFTEAYESINH